MDARVGCFTLIVLGCISSVSRFLPRGAVDWSAVCEKSLILLTTRIFSYQLVSARESFVTGSVPQKRVTYRSRSNELNRAWVLSFPRPIPITTIKKHNKMRCVAFCYDIIRSDAMVIHWHVIVISLCCIGVMWYSRGSGILTCL